MFRDIPFEIELSMELPNREYAGFLKEALDTIAPAYEGEVSFDSQKFDGKNFEASILFPSERKSQEFKRCDFMTNSDKFRIFSLEVENDLFFVWASSQMFLINL